MKYVNLSTTYYMDPAVEALKPDAERLLTRAIAFCGNAENRGEFSYAAAARLGLRRTQSLLDQLVDAGILTLVEDSSNATQTQVKSSSNTAQKQLESSSKTQIYRFEKWDDWQESGNKLLKRQEKDRERKRREREMSRDNPPPEKRREDKREEITTDVVISGGTEAEQTAPVDEPAPKPAPRKRSAPGTRITEDWLPTREAVEKLQPDVPLVDLKRETANMVDYWLGIPGKRGEKIDWLATWRKWMRKAQQDAEQRAQRFGSSARGPAAPGVHQPTARERKIAEMELRKSSPNPEILARGGLSLPADHPSLAQPRHLTAIEGGAA